MGYMAIIQNVNEQPNFRFACDVYSVIERILVTFFPVTDLSAFRWHQQGVVTHSRKRFKV